jgi:hypothetical protein
MGDAVSRPAAVYPVSLARRLKVEMVIGILGISLEKVMVDILGAEFGLHFLEPEALELQHGEGPGGILEERVVDSNGDFLARDEPSFEEMALQYFLGEVHVRLLVANSLFAGLSKNEALLK